MSADRPSPLPQTHLKPGEVVVTSEPQLVATVLGSCVSVTMFHRQSGLASICHAVLPQTPADAPPPADESERFRYVDQALPAMLDVYRRARIQLNRVEVKMFGGANVIAASREPHGAPPVGPSNVLAAKAILRAARVSITAENTGGCRGRKILFNTATGEVLHKHLARSAP